MCTAVVVAGSRRAPAPTVYSLADRRSRDDLASSNTEFKTRGPGGSLSFPGLFLFPRHSAERLMSSFYRCSSTSSPATSCSSAADRSRPPSCGNCLRRARGCGWSRPRSPTRSASDAVTIERRPFVPSDLDGAWLVVAAATPDVNRAGRDRRRRAAHLRQRGRRPGQRDGISQRCGAARRRDGGHLHERRRAGD